MGWTRGRYVACRLCSKEVCGEFLRSRVRKELRNRKYTVVTMRWVAKLRAPELFLS